jgi:hypothetical protein
MILQVDNGEVCNGAGWEVEDVNVSNFSSFVLLPSLISCYCCCVSQPTCLHLRTCALIRLLLYLPAGPAPHTCVHVPALHTAVVSLAVTRPAFECRIKRNPPTCSLSPSTCSRPLTLLVSPSLSHIQRSNAGSNGIP